jgi:GTP-binding protein EngB required for normal cell division
MATIDQTVERPAIEEVLHTLLTVEHYGAVNKGLREKLLSLEKKLASNQLHLAVLGQMKRGKSSFINALLGAEILPTGVLPVTAVVTEIKYGPAPCATILHTTGQRVEVDISTLVDYITEAGNPGNKRQVESVEITYPSSFLESGMVLIDTPGIGSTHTHNTRTTEAYLESVDAGIVVFSVDPPITEVESQFLREIKEDIPKLFFILNKTDVVSADEASHVFRFLEEELIRLQMDSPEIFPLSARQALQQKQQASCTSPSSGIELFERRLRSFLVEEKAQVLVRSVTLDALHIARTLRFATAIGVRAGEMNPTELHSKRLELDRLLRCAETDLRELQVLLRQHSADLIGRVEHDLTAQVVACVPVVRQHLRLFQAQHPKETGRAFGTLLEAFLTKEVETAFRNWRVREDDEIQTQLDEISSRFVAQANGILERLQEAAVILFETPIERLSVTCSLRVDSHLHYRVERVFYSLERFLLLLPRFLLRPIVLRRMNERLWSVLDMNAGRIRYDYLERLQSSMAQFENDLHAAVIMVTDSLKSVLSEADGKTRHQTATLDVLDSVIRDCSQLLT